MNKHAYKFEGMMPILPTAITAAYDIDYDGEKRLIDYCLKCGARAIGHLAWASEFAKLSVGQRNAITEVLVQHTAKRVPVFVGVSAPSISISLEYVKDAVKYGADMIMAAPPYACLPTPQAAYDYYKAISEAADLPIILQDVPMGKTVLDADLIWKIYCDFDNICYIKEEDTDFLYKTARLSELSKGSINIIGGYGGKHLIHNLDMGVKAFMTGTEALDIHGEVVRLYLAGQKEKAQDVYCRKLLPYLVFYEANSEELLKKMLYWRGIIDCDLVIQPCQKPPLSPQELKIFRGVLEDIGYFDFKAD